MSIALFKRLVTKLKSQSSYHSVTPVQYTEKYCRNSHIRNVNECEQFCILNIINIKRHILQAAEAHSMACCYRHQPDISVYYYALSVYLIMAVTVPTDGN